MSTRTDQRRPGHALAIVVGMALPMLLGAAAPSSSEPIDAHNLSVVDGDTIRVSGMDRSVRLVGFNTPETANAQCDAESRLGAAAAARLVQLIDSGDLNLTLVACACRPGTEGTDLCKFGRACGTLTVAGRDVGDLLISEGLAVPFICGPTRCPATPRPWCAGM